MRRLYGRTGRLTVQNGGFRPGQPLEPPISRSLEQLQAHVKLEATRLEAAAGPCELAELAHSIEAMLPLAPKVPQILYLRFLYCIRARDFDTALDSLHRYCDLFATAGGISVQYASLNVAALHLSFGHVDEALQAIDETVRARPGR
jgi:hypothetical protein